MVVKMSDMHCSMGSYVTLEVTNLWFLELSSTTLSYQRSPDGQGDPDSEN